MNHRPTPSTFLLAAVAATLAACGGGSNVSNASPRISSIPRQSTSGDSAFSLDLANYTTDREGASLVYAVTAGGGSFTGSVYQNAFDTMGDHTVEFTVTDGNKTTLGSFVVRVTKGNFAVVRESNSGLLLLDSRTNGLVRVAEAVGGPAFAQGLANGLLVYQLTGGSGQQLWIFDPLTRRSTRVLPNATTDTVYRAATNDGRIVLSTGTGNDQRLFVHNPATGLTRDIAQGLLGSNTVVVDANGIVYYEVGVNGQADVYAYDATADEVFPVGTAPTDEQIQAALPGGGVVFTRLGTAGEADLFCYRVSAGLVEVGADIPALDLRAKSFAVCGTAGQVVFTATNSGNDELYSWSPASGQTTTIASGGHFVYDAIGAGNEVVFREVVSGTEDHVAFHDLDTGVAGALATSHDLKQVLGVSSDGTTAWVFLVAGGSPGILEAWSLESVPATTSWSAGSAIGASIGILANGDVVGLRADGTALNLFDISAGSWGTPILGTGLVFGGDGIDAGDFVFAREVSGQTDLSMWDASAGSLVVVSNTVGNDSHQGRTLDGTILFTRVVSGQANADLFVWNGSTTTRLTNGTATGVPHDHFVVGSYCGMR